MLLDGSSAQNFQVMDIKEGGTINAKSKSV
jgi:hypothetical protein